MKSSDLLELSRELTRQHQPHAWITVISVTSPSSAYIGAQAIVRSDGEMSGWIGGGCVQSAARAAALRCIASAVPQRLRLSNTKDPSEAIDVRPMACASNGEVELFIQPAAVAPRLRIYGRTPIVRIAAWLAREADFDPLTDDEAADIDALANSMASASASTWTPTSTPTPASAPSSGSTPKPTSALTSASAPSSTSTPTPASAPSSGSTWTPTSALTSASAPSSGSTRTPTSTPTSGSAPSSESTLAATSAVERETYALIATQGDGDEAALEAALRSCARAVLVIASRRKAERLRTAMELRGIPQERIEVMRAPAGPDIGAVTPNEIALAAIAGLVAIRRGRTDAFGAGADVGSRASSGAVRAARSDSSPPMPPGLPSRDAQAVTGYVNPVCGAVVDPARALSSLTMEGQTHYFCCQGCRTEFERDPQKYLEIGAHMRKPARTTHE
jgi:xanthine/CO dehydrogenase XdhC/CoxF family maturation factor/YHS domain-containing protein